jgi:amino-acid N-acetyltransferase
MRGEGRTAARPTAVLTVRSATIADADGILQLVNYHARRGQLLPRTLRSIVSTIEDWVIAEVDGEIVGCVSLLRYTSGLVEVRSLAVDPHVQGLGIGARLMEELLEVAHERKITRLFALTRVVGFFERFGFHITERALFPEKVWNDCQQCPLLDNCDETAVVLDLQGRL